MSGCDVHSSHLSSHLILRFIAFCHGVRKIQSSTIRSYLAAIRFFRLKEGFQDPLINPHGAIIPQLTMALRGTRRLCSKRPKQCKPITIELLSRLVAELRKGVFDPYNDVLMHTALTTGFWGFFRSGELFPEKFSPHLHITCADVILHDDRATIHLKSSKTDVERRGVDIQLFQTRNSVCAVTALRNFIRIRDQCDVHSPFFCSQYGQPFTRRVFVSRLKHLLLRLGIDSTSYSGHSMRVGAATSAAAAGVPDHLIQALGRWSSLSYLRYIRIDYSIIQKAHLVISNLAT